MMYFSARKLQVQTDEGKLLVQETSFELDQGKVLGVYGPNGSGKTNLLKALAGVNPHFLLGEVWLNGHHVQSSLNAETKVQKVLYMGSDFPSAFEVKVKDLMEMGHASSKNPQNMDSVTQELEVRLMNSRLISTLSDGEKQWVMFARALIQNPQVLILDESFSKLDLDRLLQAVKIIQRHTENGMTVVIASHDLNFLSEVSDQLILMKNGKMLHFGEVREVLTPFYLEQLYPNLPLQVVRSPNSGKEKVIY